MENQHEINLKPSTQSIAPFPSIPLSRYTQPHYSKPIFHHTTRIERKSRLA